MNYKAEQTVHLLNLNLVFRMLMHAVGYFQYFVIFLPIFNK